MKKNYNLINLFLIVAILIGDVFYITTDLVWVKAITSLAFVALGGVNLWFAFKAQTQHKKFCIIMLVGLFFAMLGDIVLEFEFIIGALLFAIGHVFFFVAYCNISKFEWKDLIYGSIIFVPATLLITLAPIFDFGGALMEVVCVVYALIISCMTGKSIANFVKEKSALNLIIMIGSILFTFSDIMLLFNVFANLHVIFGILCLATYYPAECVLAYSILHSKNAKISK